MENNFQLPQALENKFINSAEYARKINGAYHRMRPRIFIERFKNLNTIAKAGILFFPVISVITSVSFIYGHIESAINSIYISIIIAVLLLGMVELTKNHLLTNALDTFFSNSGRSVGTFVFAFLFSCLSFVMSYNGAEMLVHSLDKSKQEIKDSTAIKMAAIEKRYYDDIAAEQLKIDNINAMAQKQWHQLHTPQQTILLNSLESNIKDLRLLMEKEKDQVLADKALNLSEAEKSVNYNAWVFKLFAGIIEVMLILSITFNAFYCFKTVREDLDLKEFRSDPAKYKTLEAKEIKVIEPIQGQAPKIGLNSGSDRNIVTGFLKKDSSVKQLSFFDDRIMDKSTNKRTCKHCGNEFDFKHWNKQYCSDDCRIHFWESRTGMKLQLKKKQ